MALEERLVVVVAGVEDVGARRIADGVAVGVHLQQVLTPASRKSLDRLSLGRVVPIGRGRLRELALGELDAVLGIEVDPDREVVR